MRGNDQLRKFWWKETHDAQIPDVGVTDLTCLHLADHAAGCLIKLAASSLRT